MAANPTPTSDRELFAQCEALIAGCEALEVELGVKQNTAETMQATMDAAISALADVDERKAERGRRREELRERDREGELVLGRCRLRLAAIFGVTFNSQWAEAGFPDGSTMVPEVFAKRLMLLVRLSTHFTTKLAHESADMGATSMICTAAFEALTEARLAVDQNKVELSEAVAVKEAAIKRLRQRMRSLIRELEILMPRDDPRWLRFGLNVPARDPMPQVVHSVVAVASGQGRVDVSWAASPYATRYTVQVRELGETEFSSVATTAALRESLSDLAQGTFVEVRVVAASETDEAAPSQPVTVAVQ